jgi:hypothetical protein
LKVLIGAGYGAKIPSVWKFVCFKVSETAFLLLTVLVSWLCSVCNVLLQVSIWCCVRAWWQCCTGCYQWQYHISRVISIWSSKFRYQLFTLVETAISSFYCKNLSQFYPCLFVCSVTVQCCISEWAGVSLLR